MYWQLHPKALEPRGEFDLPATLKLQGREHFFAPFVCFTNLLNMKLVIGAYKRILG